MDKMGWNAPEPSSRAPQNHHHLAFMGAKFTKFLLERWSLAARTLF